MKAIKNFKETKMLGFAGLIHSIIKISKFRDFFTDKQKKAFDKVKKSLLGKVIVKEIDKIKKLIDTQGNIQFIFGGLVSLLRLKPLLSSTFRSKLDAVVKKTLIYTKKHIRAFVVKFKKQDYKILTKSSTAIALYIQMDGYAEIIEKIGAAYKIKKLLFTQFQTEFKGFMQAFVEKTEKEYKRIKSSKDYLAYGKLLGVVGWVHYFKKAPFPKSQLIAFQGLREKIIKEISKLPYKDVMRHFDDRVKRMVKFRLKLPAASRQQLKGMEGLKIVGNKYFINIEGQDWRISNPDGDPTELILSLKGNEVNVFRTVRFNKVFKGKRPDMTYLKKETRTALFDFARQEKNKKFLKGFELPKNRKIGYISLFDNKFDLTFNLAETNHFAILMVKILKARGYKLDLSGMQGRPFVETGNPVKFLNEQVKKLHAKGIRDFYFDLNGHGSSAGIGIGKGINAKQLVDLFKKYPDSKFNITSIACHGGGLRKGILAYLKTAEGKKRAKDISVFLQSKPNKTNKVGQLDTAESGQNYVSNYYAVFARFLLKGMSFGQAAYAADQEVKKYYPNDAEAIVNGRLIS
jgi:ferritin-like protein